MPNLQKPIISDSYPLGFQVEENYIFKSKKGLSKAVVEEISWQKKEPSWMRKIRLSALEIFYSKKNPVWEVDLSKINFDDIYYYIRPTEKKVTSWRDLPKEIKKTYEQIGIPQAERKYLGGVNAQFESEIVYKSILKTLKKKGVIFLDMESAVIEHPDLLKKYFSTIVPVADNKFAALNTAVWSGGSFVYVPKGVHVSLPLQAYFRINAAKMGQFERTLIIADEGSFVHYSEGCTAPIYSVDSLHAAVVEIIVKKGARVRYTTVQNWSKNVYNLVTKRMRIEEEGFGEWIDSNLGSKLTMKYPSLYLVGKGARGEVLSISCASSKQHLDVGAKAIHFAPFSSSKITSKSISRGGGRSSYRGLIQIEPQAQGAKSKITCDTLLLDSFSRSDTYPTMNIRNKNVSVEHEATVSKISEEQLYYLMSRGLSQSEAQSMIVNGFIEPIVKELPLEYVVEMNKLIQLEMEGSIG